MQSATCQNLRIRSPADVRTVFHAVLLNILPMVTRRLDSEERGLILPGAVYVWEERGTQTEITGNAIRLSDAVAGIRWGPSRVREGFLFYHEKPSSHYVFPGGMYPAHRQHAPQELLIKQTYTAFVDTPRGQRKWHLIAYFTEESVDRLHCIDDYPALASLNVPHGKYKSARSVKGRPDHIFNPDSDGGANHADNFSLHYVPYDPRSVSAPSSRSSPSPQYPPRSLTWNGPSPDPSQLRRQEHRRGRSLPDSTDADFLAPLEYLETVTPPRRYPVDETALKLFKGGP